MEGSVIDSEDYENMELPDELKSAASDEEESS